MTPFPFYYLPNWANFLAIWVGYTILLLTVYCTLMATLRWWAGFYYEDRIEEWAKMRQEAQKVRDKINGPH